MILAQTLKGFRNFLPKDMAVRNQVLQVVRGVFEQYGFEPLETPALEYAETILGKYGAEADKLVYQFEDAGARKVALRYDLTVPTSRVMTEFPELPKPFKRYQIQNVWRADKPQKGRYREFTQCDVDIFGSSSPLSDAEIVKVIYEVLKNLKLSEFEININSREVLFKIMESTGIAKDKYLGVIQSIDKLDKIGWEGVEKELAEKKQLESEQIKTIFSNIKNAKPDKYLSEVIQTIKAYGVPDKFIRFNSALARGLDYYTGPIFETMVKTAKIGSVTGGGRYDKFIGLFSGRDMAAVGTTIGFDRICDVISELNLMKLAPTQTKVLVTVFSPELLNNSIKIVNELRGKNINSELYLDPTVRLDKQLKYADRKGIPFAIIAGPEEVARGGFMLKKLQSKTQKFYQNINAIKFEI